MFDEFADNDAKDYFSIAAAAPKPEDEDYLYRRAEQELELAQAATHPAVVKAHYLLADHYLESLYADATGASD